MAPPVQAWPALELPDRVQATVKGRRRKDQIELQACELFEMLQYECVVQAGRTDKEAKVICMPIERLFRRCQDRDETFIVETTAWEGKGK